ncbi:hypothetical protein BGZ82_006636, partial [Podila clonocystis]
ARSGHILRVIPALRVDILPTHQKIIFHVDSRHQGLVTNRAESEDPGFPSQTAYSTQYQIDFDRVHCPT